jgi:hypothetical protein
MGNTIIFASGNQKKKGYGFFHFIWDCFMVLITAGFWLIWIFIREMRKR